MAEAVDRPLPAATIAALQAVVETGRGQALPGGVSSDIQLVEISGRRYCVKQALARLKVQAEWRAPVERNHSEAEWMRVAGEIVPGAVPQVLHEDQHGGWFAMEYLPPEEYPVWKAQLRDGVIEPDLAATVGRCLARIHAHTAGSADIAARFATDIFYPIRPEPYLIATAERHPDLAGRLRELSDITMQTHVALVHGDVSPKNILVGPRGPVILDAECAWYGDPAFDIAFVLNHLLLKCIWRPHWMQRYMDCYTSLSGAYLSGATWESRAGLDRRAAHLLPGLLLGRVDGKSPAEYITLEADKDRIRDVARRLLREPAASLSSLGASWSLACEHAGTTSTDLFDRATSPL